MYDITQTKRSSGQNADSLILIRYTIKLSKIIVSKIPLEGGGGPMLSHGLQIIDLFSNIFVKFWNCLRDSINSLEDETQTFPCPVLSREQKSNFL